MCIRDRSAAVFISDAVAFDLRDLRMQNRCAVVMDLPLQLFLIGSHGIRCQLWLHFQNRNLLAIHTVMYASLTAHLTAANDDKLISNTLGLERCV